ncbi:hypothetical protein [Erwinia amylovora]
MFSISPKPSEPVSRRFLSGAAVEPITAPVSYTHLDVYKRQTL